MVKDDGSEHKCVWSVKDRSEFINSDKKLVCGPLRGKPEYNINSRVLLRHQMTTPPATWSSVPARTSSTPADAGYASSYCSSPPGKYHVYTTASQEFNFKAKSRQSAAPRVVGFDSHDVIPSQKIPGRSIHGFFPPVKLRHSADSPSAASNKSYTSSRDSPQYLLELSPDHHQHPARILGHRQPTPRSPHHQPPHSRSLMGTNPPVYPGVQDKVTTPAYGPCSRAESLRRSRRMLASRDNPWVYRFKVKKSMNELSKIMASKTPKQAQPV